MADQENIVSNMFTTAFVLSSIVPAPVLPFVLLVTARKYKIDPGASHPLWIPKIPSIDNMARDLSTAPSKPGERTRKFQQRKYLTSYWEVLGDKLRARKMNKKKKFKASGAEEEDRSHRTLRLVASSDAGELTMRQMAIQTALYFSHNIITVKRTMMIWYRHSCSAVHPIKHRRGHSLAKGRLDRPSSSNSSLSPTGCPPWLTVEGYKAERWWRICSEEGRRSMVSDHEGRDQACISILRLLFLEELGAEVRLVGGSLNTLGNRRRGITSRSEQE
ncbi:unnamed protein product [Alternaria burnsii]|nr:unnamed protein product [Alternaria burnsii]